MAIQETIRKAEQIFRRHGGLLRTSKALTLGVHPRTLYWLRDEGRLIEITRGVYQLASVSNGENPDLVSVAVRIPRAVICLISALYFHRITTQIPHAVNLALPPGSKKPRLDHPPLQVYRMSGKALTEGIEEHRTAGVTVRVYSPAKTVADCFKYRNKIGLDVALEALRDYKQKHRGGMDELWRFAKICRVDRVMRPYLEALA